MRLEINFFERKNRVLAYSIEMIYANLQIFLQTEKNVVCNRKLVPHSGMHIIAICKNIIFAIRERGKINHVVGDVQYLIPFLGNKSVLTIHDCGNGVEKSLIKKYIYQLFWIKLPVKFAKLIIVVSEQTKTELIEIVGYTPSSLKVIHNFVQPNFSFFNKTFNFKCPNILHIGSTKNKNLMRHIKSIQNLVCTLTIIGMPSDEECLFLQKNCIKYFVKHSLTTEELIAEYKNADVLLFASLYEGFGLPVIEAQALGIPVITSNISPLNTIAGNGAVLVDPYDVDDIRGAIISILENKIDIDDLRTKGLENISKYRIDKVGCEFYNAYLTL
jgi:glycosyltransferase involved in cell wall biosynthesis